MARWVIGPIVLVLSVTQISADRDALVAYYAAIHGPVQTTMCADTYGHVILFRGSPRKHWFATPETYSICIETDKGERELSTVFERAGIDYGFGALRR